MDINIDDLFEAYKKGITKEDDLDKTIFDTEDKRKVAIGLMDAIRKMC